MSFREKVQRARNESEEQSKNMTEEMEGRREIFGGKEGRGDLTKCCVERNKREGKAKCTRL